MRYSEGVVPPPVIAAVLAALCLGTACAQPEGALTELTDLRTATSKTWLGANGTITAEIFAGPIHYKDTDGAWKEIDTTLGPAAKDGFGWSVVKSPVKVHLATNAAGRQEIDLDGASLSFAPVGARPRPGSPTAVRSPILMPGLRQT